MSSVSCELNFHELAGQRFQLILALFRNIEKNGSLMAESMAMQKQNHSFISIS